MVDLADDEDPDDLLKKFYGEPIFTYTTEQAVEDGVLVETGRVGRHRVYFTRTLWEEGYEDLERRTHLVRQGLELLRQPDPEDTNYMKLRVIEEDKIWVIAEPGKVTYMKPEDY